MLIWPIVVPDALEAKPPWSTATPTDRILAERGAVQILWALTGRHLGTRQVTVRPVFGPPDERTTYQGTSFPSVAPSFFPVDVAWGSCGCTSDLCNCRDRNRLKLPGPVAAVLSVTIDGVELDPDQYKLKNRRWLLRTDGGGWPQNQDLTADDDAVGAFTVTYTRGIDVAQAGQVAAGILAVEVLKGIQRGTSDCSLPFGITNIDREGVSIQIDPSQILADGLTGLDKVDRWVLSVNPYKVKSPARVIVPGQSRTPRFR